MLSIKKGVNLHGIKAEIMIPLMVFNRVLEDFGYKCVITSCTDGNHGYKSKHKVGCALDIRSKHIGPTDKKRVIDKFYERIGGDDYIDLILEDEGTENEHFHIEYDPK